MSSDFAPGGSDVERDVVDTCEDVLRRYYEDAVAELELAWPDRTWLTVSWQDVRRVDMDLADDWLAAPDTVEAHMTAALRRFDALIEANPSEASIRLVDLPEDAIYTPVELAQVEEPGYVGVRGDLSKVTTPAHELQTAMYVCNRCGAYTKVAHHGGERQVPASCDGCDRQSSFRIDLNHDETTFRDYCRLRIETPPDESGELQSEYIDGEVRGELVWAGHDDYGLVARSGDHATVYGTVEYEELEHNDALFREYLDVRAVEFDTDASDVDIPAHRDAFEALADRPDAVDVFAKSIAPELYATPEWERALELLVAYLFAAPRIDIDGGPTFRGDIHALIISDYGMGKSMVNEAVAMFSHDCIKESATGLSSDVGLLAAAVKDDFAGEQWTLQPGLLVRGNGGHVILDEIDKTDADLERMNNALEGEQLVDINKAGQSATYKSRVGLLATGNPEDARFDPMEPISDQLNIDQSLLSRFDGIVTMHDQPDSDQDAAIAETQGLAYVEAQEYAHGEREELDRLDRVVEPAVGRAWVAYARDDVHPLIGREHVDRIKDWYAEEVRQLNHEFAAASADGRGDSMPVPATARVVAGTIRFAVAFARCHLRDRVTDSDVDRAMSLAKDLIGQQFDGVQFVPHEAQHADSQEDRIDVIRETIRGADGCPHEDVLAAATDAGIDKRTAEQEIQSLKDRGEVYEPETGVYRLV